MSEQEKKTLEALDITKSENEKNKEEKNNYLEEGQFSETKKYDSMEEKKNDTDIDEIENSLQNDLKNAYIEIPDSLKPENIEKMLAGDTAEASSNADISETESDANVNASATIMDEQTTEEKQESGKKKRTFQWKKAHAYAAIAASLCIILGITAAINYSDLTGNQNMANNAANNSGSDASGKTSSSKNKSDAQDSTGKSSDVEETSKIASAEDYDQVYSYIKTESEDTSDSVGLYQNETAADTSQESSAANTSSAEGSASAKSTVTADTAASDAGYSDTNVREEGVGEADIVKTDGKYLYILQNNSEVRIVDIQQSEMQDVASIELEQNYTTSEIYVQDNKLFIFFTTTNTSEDKSIYDGGVYRESATVKTYDITDRSAPKEIGSVSQSGSYYSMRVVDGYIYLLSQFYVNTWQLQKDDLESYIPYVQGKAIPIANIYMPPYSQANQYMVVTSIDMNDPENVVDSKGIFSQGGTCYVSSSHIYMCDSVYADNASYTRTSIRKISFKDGKLSGVAQTKVWGTLNDSFSIDEYKGNLRLVTTVNASGGFIPWLAGSNARSTDTSAASTDNGSILQDSNALYILDEDLELLGKIEGLAKDETVYSARFMGDSGYFVTFRQTDPLFSVDLSDPENPKILDYLKIPGFSEYLHPYGDGQLLGIGMDADDNGITGGVKLSMFDISDPSNVAEAQTSLIDHVYSTDVGYNYKSVLIDTEKNLIGFSAYGDAQHYYIYGYDKDSGFTCLLDRKVNGSYGTLRGVYSGNTLYIIEGNAIEAFDLETFEKIDDIVL
ncbi:MAG: beta-propeller domain-containing protein [Hespellia sp.]|nr:beta-propeller domain-containing protein [Hespellia sp.]